jgi:large-conductance mechanosensitive channel
MKGEASVEIKLAVVCGLAFSKLVVELFHQNLMSFIIIVIIKIIQ